MIRQFNLRSFRLFLNSAVLLVKVLQPELSPLTGADFALLARDKIQNRAKSAPIKSETFSTSTYLLYFGCPT